MTQTPTLDNTSYLRKNEIQEKIHFDKLDESSRYAQIIIDISNLNGNKDGRGIRALMDTGATHTCINEEIISRIIDDINLYPHESVQGSSGIIQSRKIPNIGIRLNPLMDEGVYIPLPFVKTCKLNNGFYAIIGNDILCMCEFIYNGLSKTYILKFYHT